MTIILLTTINTITAIEDNETTTQHTEQTNIKQEHTITKTYIQTQTETTKKQPKNTTTNQTKQLTKNKTEKITKTDSETYTLTQYNQYIAQNMIFPDNSLIIINETLTGCNLDIENHNITIIGNNNAQLINSYIAVYEGDVHIANLTFINDDGSTSSENIYIDGDNNILENLQFTDCRIESPQGYYRQIDITGNNNTIYNCTFDVEYPALRIDWDYYGAECKSEIIVVRGNNNTIKENTLIVRENDVKDFPFGTIRGISVYGSNNLIDRNSILIEGTLYLYGISVYYHNNRIENNYIEVNSVRYASGIALNGQTSNNTLKNNTIIVTTQDTALDYVGTVDSAYAIVITESEYYGGTYNNPNSKTTDNIIEGNEIYGTSSHMYGIEQFGGTRTIIRDNLIDIDGKHVMALALIGSSTEITDNVLIARGTTNQSDFSADYLKPQTTGILLMYGDNTTINGNIISTEYGTAFRSYKEDGTLITNNIMQVENNEVSIEVLGDRGTTTIYGNEMNNINNQIINGNNIEMYENYDMGEKPDDIPPYNPGTQIPDTPENPINNTNNTDTTDNENQTIPDTNNTDVPDDTNPETNTTDIPENPISNSTEPPEDPQTEPENNSTELPEQPVQNNTEVPEEPDINNTEIPEEPELNNTEIPEPPEQNETIIPEEPELNNTEEPEQPEQNETIIPEEPELNNTEEPEKPEQNETIIPEEPELPIQNETIIPEEPEQPIQNNTIIPEQPVTEVNNTIIPKEETQNTTTPPKNNTTPQRNETLPQKPVEHNQTIEEHNINITNNTIPKQNPEEEDESDLEAETPENKENHQIPPIEEDIPENNSTYTPELEELNQTEIIEYENNTMVPEQPQQNQTIVPAIAINQTTTPSENKIEDMEDLRKTNNSNTIVNDTTTSPGDKPETKSDSDTSEPAASPEPTPVTKPDTSKSENNDPEPSENQNPQVTQVQQKSSAKPIQATSTIQASPVEVYEIIEKELEEKVQNDYPYAGLILLIVLFVAFIYGFSSKIRS